VSDHDLHRYMSQLTSELADEYERIRAKTQDDPGTAGDEGEENWAGLLRRWLPAAYHVVTKGRLLAHDGSASRQVDLIVLRPSYPPVLRDKKHYLLGGVAAAFECKTTLRSEHLAAAAERCKEIKQLPTGNTLEGSPWKELRGGVVYGLLAHSHEWKRDASTPSTNITDALHRDLVRVVEHPREMLDVVCIADLATWHSSVMTALPHMFGSTWAAVRDRNGYPDDGGVAGLFIEQAPLGEAPEPLPAPVGVALATFYERLAQVDACLRPIADYVRMANLYGSGAGTGRVWPLTVLSEDVARRLRSGHISSVEAEQWGEWRPMFF
jgi:hypothetical protein